MNSPSSSDQNPTEFVIHHHRSCRPSLSFESNQIPLNWMLPCRMCCHALASRVRLLLQSVPFLETVLIQSKSVVKLVLDRSTRLILFVRPEKYLMIVVMANLLDYDVYDIKLNAVKENAMVIEDINCSLDLTGQRDKKKKTEKHIKKKIGYNHEKADVAENLMPKSDYDVVETYLKILIQALKDAKMKIKLLQ
ncbi:hypothetical protein F3Y22_tig00112993pilonHSYRG00009 [Hibiscus syriacus]|uniref:AAA+ ATPase At3g28540-like C-terminal domain-containing protein n=1 Tax=Hibiscus syriacus TaxID=106335 RepID=A0A6A2WS45_HIBSY|nr:hypothetical protein F3Y22_tig00112993pilonHSYRG00009 [Hibiscus syriacus]